MLLANSARRLPCYLHVSAYYSYKYKYRESERERERARGLMRSMHKVCEREVYSEKERERERERSLHYSEKERERERERSLHREIFAYRDSSIFGGCARRCSTSRIACSRFFGGCARRCPMDRPHCLKSLLWRMCSQKLVCLRERERERERKRERDICRDERV